MKKYVLPFLLIGLIFYLPFAVAQERPFAFVAIGDTGCGCSGQEKTARKLQQWHASNPFSTVLMLGDNIYGSSFGTRGGNKQLFGERFDEPYGQLIQSGVKFYATLGNHDLETRAGVDLIQDKKRFNILGSKGYYDFYSEEKSGWKASCAFHFLEQSRFDQAR